MALWYPQFFNTQFFDENGDPVASGFVEALYTGTSTHAPTYNSNGEENANPIGLDASGRCQLKISDAITYDFKIYDENMALVNTVLSVATPVEGTPESPTSHNELVNRNAANSHPQSAITNLVDDLADKLSKSETNRQYLNGNVTILGGATFAAIDSDSIKNQSSNSYAEMSAFEGISPAFKLNQNAGANTNINDISSHVITSATSAATHSTSIGTSVKEELSKTIGGVSLVWNRFLNSSYDLYDYMMRLVVSGNKITGEIYRYISDSAVRVYAIFTDPNTGKNSSIDQLISATQAEIEVRNGNTNKVEIYCNESESFLIPRHSGKATIFYERGIKFETNPETVGTIAEGNTQWNATDHTLEFGMGNGVVQQVGNELPFYSKNVDGTNVLNGQIGYIYGASGQRIAMKKPSASNNSALKAMFMATQDVADNNSGFFNAIGLVRSLDTSAFAEGAEVWLDTVSGNITDTVPAKPNYQARMGYVVNSHATQGSIFFHPFVSPKIGDLSDCDTTGISQGDFLTLGSDNVFKTNVFYDDWRWAGSGINPPGIPVAATLKEVATNEWHWVFVNNATMAFPNQQIPHDYKEGTDIVPHIHFCSTTTETYTGTWTAVITLWESGATGATKTTYTRTASFNKALTAFVMDTIEFDSVISGTGRKISSCGSITLSLALSSGVSCALLGFDGHYQKDRFGSNEINTK